LQDGKIEAYVKSDEIPEKNDEPVKVVVSKSFNQMVLESGKNGMLRISNPSLRTVVRDLVLVFECPVNVEHILQGMFKSLLWRSSHRICILHITGFRYLEDRHCIFYTLKDAMHV
jgi:hypothetical protein